MIKRKDKTVKQLQAECRKRKIGFMMNWTKIALTKRLEDEDRKDKELLEAENVKKEQDKEINKLKAAIKTGIKKAEEKKDSEILKLEEKMSALPSVENEMKSLLARKIIERADKRLMYEKLDSEQKGLVKQINEIADLKIEIGNEIGILNNLIKSLK